MIHTSVYLDDSDSDRFRIHVRHVKPSIDLFWSILNTPEERARSGVIRTQPYQGLKLKDGEIEVRCMTVRQPLPVLDAFTELKRFGVRPLVLEEAIAFEEQFPEVATRRGLLAFLGSALVSPSGIPAIVLFYATHDGRAFMAYPAMQPLIPPITIPVTTNMAG